MPKDIINDAPITTTELWDIIQLMSTALKRLEAKVADQHESIVMLHEAASTHLTQLCEQQAVIDTLTASSLPNVWDAYCRIDEICGVPTIAAPERLSLAPHIAAKTDST